MLPVDMYAVYITSHFLLQQPKESSASQPNQDEMYNNRMLSLGGEKSSVIGRNTKTPSF